jgi:hypothetical protein
LAPGLIQGEVPCGREIVAPGKVVDLCAELGGYMCCGISRAGVGDNHLVSDATDGLEGPGKVLLFVPRNQTNA